jgi:hypothetical protein
VFDERMQAVTRTAVAVATMLASLGCDAFVRARVRVVSTQGSGIPDALLRRQRASDHDLARFTDADGCAYFSGVVGPARTVRVAVEKPGYVSQTLDLSVAREQCFIVGLRQEGSGNSSVRAVGSDACPCSGNAGYSPTLAARFKVTGPIDQPVESVGVRRSDRQRNPWLWVSDARGCMGIKWIVPAGQREIPLVLEKAGFQSASLTVPTMDDRCYTVHLALSGADGPSAVASVTNENCVCEMFSGRNTWPEK